MRLILNERRGGCGSRRVALRRLVHFSHVAAANTFTTTELYPQVRDSARPPGQYTLASLRKAA